MRWAARDQVDSRLLAAAVLAWLAALWLAGQWNLPGAALLPSTWINFGRIVG